VGVPLLALLKNERPRLLWASSLTFTSSFGQTFFLSLFTVEIAASFAISSGTLGLVYGGATLLAGFMLPVVGGTVDTRPARPLATLSALLLALGLALIATAPHVAVVAVGLFLARFLGQGFMTHLASTYVARTFMVGRGSALGLTALGYPLGEAILPSAFVALLAGFGWRTALLVAAGAIAFVLLPLSHAFIGKIDTGPTPTEKLSSTKKPPPFFVLRMPSMWLVIPFWVAHPFVLTALFFHQRALGGSLGLDAAAIATAFVAFALGRIIFTFATGPLVDRFSGKRLFLFDLWPVTVGLLGMLVLPGAVAFPLYLLLAGIGVGFSGNVKTAFLAEAFGTERLGAIKSSIATFSVLSTAIAPPLSGYLLDHGVTFPTLLVWLIVYILVSTAMASVGVRMLIAGSR
jgi:MFS family permease